LLHATTVAPDGAEASSATRTLPHLSVLATPELAQVGASVPLGPDEVALHRGALNLAGEPLADPMISRRQGIIRCGSDGRHELIDVGSRHGTWVNGARLAPDTPTPIGPGDRIYLGRTLLYLHLLPHDPEGWERDAALRRVATQCRDRESQRAEQRALAEVHARLSGSAAVGVTLGWREVRREILAAARLTGPVLVTGPTGTGKEAIARAIHDASIRRRGPFLAFSCAEVAPNLVVAELFGAQKGAYTGAERDRPGLWRAAAHGTMFLDEVGDAPAELQAALLRAIESGAVRPVGASEAVPVDVRLVAATKRELDEEVAGGRFRDDLLFRLAGTHISLRPLIERPADALVLFMTGLARFGMKQARLPLEVVEALWHHGWPGNGREVMHLTERVAADAAQEGDLALPAGFGGAAAEALEPAERGPVDRAAVEASLRKHQGNLTAVARDFGVRRQQVYRWVERFGIALEALRPKE